MAVCSLDLLDFIRLRHDTFTDAGTANVDFVAKTLGNLVDRVSK